MRICVFGAGAIGGYLAAKLAAGRSAPNSRWSRAGRISKRSAPTG